MKGIILQFLSLLSSSISIILTKILYNKYDFQYAIFLLSIITNVVLYLIIIVCNTHRINNIRKVNIYEESKIGVLNAIGQILAFESLKLLHPFILSLFSRSHIFFSKYLAIFILKEKVSLTLVIITIINAFGGLLFLYSPTTGFYNDIYIGTLIVLAHSFLFALANVLAYKECNYNSNTIFSISLNNLITFCIILIANIFRLPDISLVFLACEKYDILLIILSSICSLISSLLFFIGSKITGFVHGVFIRSLNPLFLWLLSVPFFNLQLNFINIIGVILSITSILLFSFFQKLTNNKT